MKQKIKIKNQIDFSVAIQRITKIHAVPPVMLLAKCTRLVHIGHWSPLTHTQAHTHPTVWFGSRPAN